jgi:hypothetical protein
VREAESVSTGESPLGGKRLITSASEAVESWIVRGAVRRYSKSKPSTILQITSMRA